MPDILLLLHTLFFLGFGGVVEIKICSKQQSGRQQPGRVTPAFAFVTFETAEAVDKMLSSLPINDFRGQLRLNIEKKQERDRERERGGNNFHGGSGGGNFSRGGQQGGAGGQSNQQGGRGGMRGGNGMQGGRRFAPRAAAGSTYDHKQQ